MSPTILDTTVLPTALTEEEIELTLRRLDFSVTGPRPDTYRMDTVVACSCSSSSSRPRQGK